MYLYLSNASHFEIAADRSTGLALYLLIWPEDGHIQKEDVRKMYDGTLFFEIAEKYITKRGETN